MFVQIYIKSKCCNHEDLAFFVINRVNLKSGYTKYRSLMTLTWCVHMTYDKAKSTIGGKGMLAIPRNKRCLVVIEVFKQKDRAISNCFKFIY
jgi:hypothetical protein